VTGDAWPLSRAVRTSTFWLLWGAFSATWIPVFIPLVHLPRYARDLGFSPLAGAYMISALGGGAVAGRLTMGALSDRAGRRITTAVAMGLQVVAFVAFMHVTSLTALYGTALFYGYAYGAGSTLFTAIVGDFFGRKQAGTLVGVLFAMAGSMGGVGPLVAGIVHDATGSYAPALALAAGLNGVAVVLLLLCRPPRDFSTAAGSRRSSPGSSARRG
jgi:MFS family permease